MALVRIFAFKLARLSYKLAGLAFKLAGFYYKLAILDYKLASGWEGGWKIPKVLGNFVLRYRIAFKKFSREVATFKKSSKLPKN